MRSGRGSWSRKLPRLLLLCGLLFGHALLDPGEAQARRSGASFGGRSFGTAPRPVPGGHVPVGAPRGGGGFFFFPAFLPFGMGGGGLGGLIVLGALGLGAFYLARTVWPAHRGGAGWDAEPVPSGKAHVHRLQLALGRSGREVRARLARFAETGDTGSEQGLARLLSQTALELLRQRASIRHAGFSTSGPLSLTHAETKLGGLALKERSGFQVERLRAGDGKLVRSQEPAAQSDEVLEYVVVTLIVATRSPLPGTPRDGIASTQDAEQILTALGGIAPADLLGLEVIWTPADEEDALTEADLLTAYPELRNV